MVVGREPLALFHSFAVELVYQQPSTPVRHVGKAPGYRHPKGGFPCPVVSPLLRVRRVRYVHHPQPGIAICHIGIAAGNSDATSIARCVAVTDEPDVEGISLRDANQ